MPISREKKKLVIEKVEKAFKDAKTPVFVHFKGLSVADTNAMRKGLKEKGVSYFVAKKTLIHRALESLSFSGEKPKLDGEVAIAYGLDLISPAREIHTFEKKFKEAVKIIGGVFDGKFFSREEMVGIAAIPERQVLLGQFVNLVNSPIQALVIALNQIADKKS